MKLVVASAWNPGSWSLVVALLIAAACAGEPLAEEDAPEIVRALLTHAVLNRNMSSDEPLERPYLLLNSSVPDGLEAWLEREGFQLIEREELQRKARREGPLRFLALEDVVFRESGECVVSLSVGLALGGGDADLDGSGTLWKVERRRGQWKFEIKSTWVS